MLRSELVVGSLSELGAMPVDREHSRALRLADSLDDPPSPEPGIRTAVGAAWRWLAHNARVALAATDDGVETLRGDVAPLRELIRSSRIALVTTRDHHGSLHMQPMEAANRQFDGEIWFATPDTAPVVDHVRSRAPVQVTYVDGNSNRSLVINGLARVCRAAGSGRARRSAMLPRWFASRRDDAGRTFIRVDVLSADVWE